jgi:hypothetical protein
MHRFIALFLILSSATASAEMFRRIGPDGEVYFSDRPSPGSEPVDLRPAQTVNLADIRRPSAATEQSPGVVSEDAPAPAYAQFESVKPSNGQGVRANDGSVTVYLSLQPALRAGDTIELIVDGEDGPKIQSGDTLNFNLSDMSRGGHTVAARVKSQQGEKLIETGPVRFYVLRVALGG